jgi:hypothetical protein
LDASSRTQKPPEEPTQNNSKDTEQPELFPVRQKLILHRRRSGKADFRDEVQAMLECFTPSQGGAEKAGKLGKNFHLKFTPGKHQLKSAINKTISGSA